MKNILIIFLCALAILAAGFFLGRSTIEEKTVIAPTTVNVDPVKNLLIEAKGDSVALDELTLENQELKRRLQERRKTAPPITTSNEPLKAPQPVMVPVWPLDTTLQVAARATSVTESDTSVSSAKLRVHLKLRFIGAPANLFELQNLSIDPFTFDGRETITEKRDLLPPIGSFVSLSLGASWNGSIGIGAVVRIGKVTGGAFAHKETEEYFLSYQALSF